MSHKAISLLNNQTCYVLCRRQSYSWGHKAGFTGNVTQSNESLSIFANRYDVSMQHGSLCVGKRNSGLNIDQMIPGASTTCLLPTCIPDLITGTPGAPTSCSLYGHVQDNINIRNTEEAV